MIHYVRDLRFNLCWRECNCDNPFDSHDIISYGLVPIMPKRNPGNLGDINLWNL